MREETMVSVEAADAPTTGPTANVIPREVPMNESPKDYDVLARMEERERKLSKQRQGQLLIASVLVVSACIDKWLLGAASWPEAAGHGIFVILCLMAVGLFLKALRPFPWVLLVLVAVTCARKWLFDAPTWNAALDTGLGTAVALLCFLHFWKRR